MGRTAVFIDGVKVLAEGWGATSGLTGLRLRSVVPRLIAELRRKDVAVILLSNEPLVASGDIAPEEIRKIHDRLRQLLTRRHTRLDAVYYCADDPKASVREFRRDTPSRLPGTEMFRRAADELDLALDESWTISVESAHVEGGRRAGCATIMIGEPAGPGKAVGLLDATVRADHHEPDLEAGISRILQAVEKPETAPTETSFPTRRPSPASSDGEAPASPETDEPEPPDTEAPAASAFPWPKPEPPAEPEPEPAAPAPPAEPASESEPPAAPAESVPDAESDPDAESEPESQAPLPEVPPEPEPIVYTPPPPPPDASRPDRVERLLEEVVDQLRAANRLRRYDDWSLARLAGTLTQVFALGMGAWAAVEIISLPPLDPLHGVTLRLAGVIVLQLLSLTLLIVATRGK